VIEKLHSTLQKLAKSDPSQEVREAANLAIERIKAKSAEATKTKPAETTKAKSTQESRTRFDTEGEIRLSWYEMQNGAERKMSFNSETFTVRIPPGGEPGRVIRVLGKGSVDPPNQQRGNLYLVIVADSSNSDEQIAANQGVTQEMLGVETIGGVMTPIILRDTPLPTQKAEIFSTAVDGQNNIEIHVLRGNQKFTHENTSLGTFRLEGIQPAPRGIPQIEVTFTVNKDGFLSISARDLSAGNKLSISRKGDG